MASPTWAYKRERDNCYALPKQATKVEVYRFRFMQRQCLRKQRKVSFSKVKKSPKTERLKLVHNNVWDKASVPPLSGSLYFVTFIDDTSRKVCIYFLKQKSDMFDVFKKWLAQIENRQV